MAVSKKLAKLKNRCFNKHILIIKSINNTVKIVTDIGKHSIAISFIASNSDNKANGI